MSLGKVSGGTFKNVAIVIDNSGIILVSITGLSDIIGKIFCAVFVRV